ncbi:MAG: L,L-diaminopimelate aminotransferase, DapL2 type [uncultured Thermoleophilia bacterium]|uniref:Aminotransferase n=1 Tax=uncultured Thermoleophilia bacterium TaxID=1497501 RepID=A0A6J4UAY3_9ACTN|nr:MAG: L,L-diaminopimelate aminotransferase, DapL2 type [uncultured Thermoleophilia bacterium]
MRPARRLEPLPEYLAARLNRLVAERRAAGRDVISLGVGDPDLPPSRAARAALAAAVQRDDVAHYPTNWGLRPLREAVARFYDVRFGVTLDPDREVLPLLGAKEGLAHLCLAQLDPGDAALVADPGYPVYVGGPVLAGAEPVPLPLRADRGFLPDLDAVPAADRARANLAIVGYPNNPTGAVADDAFFARLAAFGLDADVPICHDNAYSEIAFDGYVAPSFLAAPDAREAGIEILSLSKAFSLPGWRLAFAVGNAAMVANLHRLKAHVDAGVFEGLQRAAVHLLDSDPAERRALADVYARRRTIVVDALRAAGLDVPAPRGGMYVWMPIPTGEPSVVFAARILEQTDVVVSPGAAYGAAGEGFVRLALTVPEPRLREALERLTEALVGP